MSCLFGDSLELEKSTDFIQVLQLLKNTEVGMVEPSPRSGTYLKLSELWASAGIQPNWDMYENTGSSAQATLSQAAHSGFYTFADIGIYMANRDELISDLALLYRNDTGLQNEISAIVVNAKKINGVRQDLAEHFLEYLISIEGQHNIADFAKQVFGTTIYLPTAHTDKNVIARSLQSKLLQENRYKNILISVVLSFIIMALLILGFFIYNRRLLSNRRQIEQDLEHARHAKFIAEEADKFKSEFLTRMSHELRTPMNAILGFSQLLEMDLQDEVHKSSAMEIITAGDHLMLLINEILDLAKIEAGKIELSLENINFNAIVDECFTLTKPLAAKHDIHVINNIGLTNNYTIHVDRTRFKQVMLNLLSNAIKYNNDNGTVTLNCDVIDENHLRINVSDTGNGLTEQQQQSLFKPFHRMEEHKHIEGAGIGLVITKQLIEKMGGMIGVKSQTGQGSTFWVQVELSEK